MSVAEFLAWDAAQTVQMASVALEISAAQPFADVEPADPAATATAAAS